MRLTVKDASFHYDGSRSGFEDISLSLGDGEVLSILGPNGCGKTTLLKCLNALIRLDAGSIAVDGRDIAYLPREEVARSIGYVPQQHQPVFPFTVLDSVLIGRAPHLGMLSSPKAEDISIAEQALETMGIAYLKDKPYTEISGGERQLAIFARVLTQQPSLLLLDEPTSHLDFGNQIRLLGMVENLAATGLPIIMTSHFPDHAFLVSSRVALMKEGRIIGVGTPDEVITDSSLEEVYNIRVKVVSVDGDVSRKICVPVGNCRPAAAAADIFRSGGIMSDFEFYLEKAAEFHGHVCAGIALGTQMSLVAMKALGLDPRVRNKNLIVYAEIDRCMTDAVQVVTGCTLGHRSLKYVDYGRFAATYVNLDTGKAVRATVKEKFSNEATIEETVKKIAAIPENELVTLEAVTVDIPEVDLPGMPREKAVCESCGERVMDGRTVKKDGKVLCRACAGGSYYKPA